MTEQIKLTLEEMRRSFDLYSIKSNRLDEKANWLLVASSIVFSLFGFLNLSPLSTNQSCLYWVIITLALLGYGIMVWSSISAFFPRDYNLPISTDWEVVSKGIISLPVDEAYSKVVSSYIESISTNRNINDVKASRIRLAACLLPIIIVLLFISNIISA